jgi:PKD repeat protein
LKTSGGTVIATCASIPCQFTLDVGDQGQFLDSGWMVAKIINLPVDGRPLTISYQVTGTKDSSKPTWAYWDNVNTPPIAKFSMAPSDPQEGDVVQFLDLSYDPDPGDTIVSRTWVINGQTFTSQNPFFVFPDEGIYSASLTVVDSFGASTTIRDGETATDGDLVPDLSVANARPLVNALNIEALAGRETALTGRFLDAGYDDTHTATWSINGNPPATVEEEHDPLLSSGLVSGKVTPTGNLTGTLTVNDGDGATASDSFSLSVIPDTPASHQRFEPNDTTTDPLRPVPILRVDRYVSFLQREGDIDLYEVSAPEVPRSRPAVKSSPRLTNPGQTRHRNPSSFN